MPWFKACLVLLLVSPAWAIDGYVVGGGVESDDTGGLGMAAFTDIGLSKKTHLSLLVGQNSVDLPRDLELDTINGNIGLDRVFEHFGFRLEFAYWGDNEILDSRDWRGALYWRNDSFTISGELEQRNFEFDIFRDDALPGQDISFQARGYGLSTSFRLSDKARLSLRGINYDYNVDLQRAANRPIVDLLSVSRLSLINSLVSHRASAALSFDIGNKVLSMNYGLWKVEADGTTTHSATLRFLTPIGKTRDIEFGLGVDDSERYGSVSFFSVYLYFYGG